MTQSRRERYSRDEAGTIDLFKMGRHRGITATKNSKFRPAPRNRILDEVLRLGTGPAAQPRLLTCPRCQAVVSLAPVVDPARRQVVAVCPACRSEVARAERQVGSGMSTRPTQLGR